MRIHTRLEPRENTLSDWWNIRPWYVYFRCHGTVYTRYTHGIHQFHRYTLVTACSVVLFDYIQSENKSYLWVHRPRLFYSINEVAGNFVASAMVLTALFMVELIAFLIVSQNLSPPKAFFIKDKRTRPQRELSTSVS